MISFRSQIIQALVDDLLLDPTVLAVWEGGSAANGTVDEYSDVDLIIMASESRDLVFGCIETALNRFSVITHRMVERKEFLPGYAQRIYFIKDAPKHFFIDVGVFLQRSEDVLAELLQTERHGIPVVYFDKLNLVLPSTGRSKEIVEKHRMRLIELEEVFPVYLTSTLKELDRGHLIDAFSFYFGGVIKPLVELLGILHRPHKYDFGMRYLHKTFPQREQNNIERFLYVANPETIRDNCLEAEELFQQTLAQLKARLEKS